MALGGKQTRLGGELPAHPSTDARPRLWEPLGMYRKGERVIDRERDDVCHTEEGGIFEAVADLRAGYLNPRYVEKDWPGAFWKRVSA